MPAEHQRVFLIEEKACQTPEPRGFSFIVEKARQTPEGFLDRGKARQTTESFLDRGKGLPEARA